MAWKTVGGMRLAEMRARTVDAFCVLANELAREMSDGE